MRPTWSPFKFADDKNDCVFNRPMFSSEKKPRRGNRALVAIVYLYIYYRPQRSWAKVMFLQASVILLTGGGVSASVHAGIPPPGSRPPLGPDPPGADTPPGTRHPPPPEANSGIRSTSGRYASYWNAFLCSIFAWQGWLVENPNALKIIEIINAISYFIPKGQRAS